MQQLHSSPAALLLRPPHTSTQPLFNRTFHGLHVASRHAPQEDAKVGLTAAWEAKTDARLAANATQAAFESLASERAAAIGARRAALAAKLAAEEAGLKAELLAAQETPAQRRAAMAERARALAAQREAERQVCGPCIRPASVQLRPRLRKSCSDGCVSRQGFEALTSVHEHPQALAQELMDAAFRENCDPLRERYSRWGPAACAAPVWGVSWALCGG